MKSKAVKSPLALACAIVALVCVAGVLTFAGPCVHDDGTTATCHAAHVAIVVAGCIAMAGSVAGAFAGGKAASLASSAIVAVAGAVVAASPGALFPLCMMQTMRCHVMMQPFSEVMGVAVLAMAAVSFIRALRRPGRVEGAHA